MVDRLAVTDDAKASQREAVGTLCDWLQAAGFKVETNHTAMAENECKWYAWRQLPVGTRDCACNDKPPSLIVTPHLFTIRDRQYASAEVSVTGQSGAWFRLKAYGLGVDELPAALPDIEAALSRAWESLATTKQPAQEQTAEAPATALVDWLGLALDLESQARRVESQSVERAMLAAAHGLRLMGGGAFGTTPAAPAAPVVTADAVRDALIIALDGLDEIALAGMSGTGMESEEGMRAWHARRAWEFIGIAARAKEAARAAMQSTEAREEVSNATVPAEQQNNGDSHAE